MSRLIRENEIGLLECIDENTGKLIWRQLPSKAMLKRIKAGKPIKLKNKPDPRTQGGRPTSHPFSAYYASLIIEKVIEGYTITAIGKMAGMPPSSTIYYWSKRYRDFGNLLVQARLTRSEMIFDRIIDLVELAQKTNVQALRLQIETLKWAYEVASRAVN